jgi:hypothetical protein
MTSSAEGRASSRRGVRCAPAATTELSLARSDHPIAHRQAAGDDHGGAAESDAVLERQSSRARCATSSRSTTRSSGPRPKSGKFPWPATDERIFEYACHEGNYAMGNILRGARLAEREAIGGDTSTPGAPEP